jgi:hypothetical protein
MSNNKETKPKATPKPTPAPSPIPRPEEPESFIVQNILASYHCISDLGLTFGPQEVIDLTYYDSAQIKSSKDLRMSLRQGLLVKITQEEWDQITELQLAEAKAKMLKQQKQRQREIIDIEDKQIDAEVLDLNKANPTPDEEVSTSGNVNDPLTYATAYAAALAEARAKGKTLNAAEFSKKLENNPGLINLYLNPEKSSARGITSGISKRGKATVMMPPVNEGDDSSTQQLEMTNYNRDHRIAGAEGMGIDQGSYGEEIDLAEDD